MIEESLIQLRQALHQYPEVSWEEHETRKRIRAYIEEVNPDELIELAQTGILFIFDSGREGPTVLFRSELDALPIREINEDLEYKSTLEGQGHKCGHDGHAAMVAGTARYFGKNRPQKGRVAFIFQPAEEVGEGAQVVLDDPNWKLEPDWVFALHNIPGVPKHQILVRDQVFTPSVKSIIIHLNGRTAHAAEPEHGISPSMMVSDLLRLANEWTHNKPEDDTFCVITPIQILMGEEAFGTAAGEADVKLTIRTWREAQMEKLSERLTAWLTNTAANYELEVEWSFTQVFKTTRNSPDANDLIRKVAKAENLDLVENDVPYKWGEDFGLFTQKYRGAMFGLGSGEDTPALHNPDYDFPDDILETGIKMFTGLAEEILKANV